MRILLDTNVWRRLSDAGEVEPLRMQAKARRAHVLVAPGVVYEMLRTPDPALRGRLVKAVTLGTWTRLMTEAFEECRDVRLALERHRPEWRRDPPDLAAFHHARADWAGGRGFWARARHDTAGEARRIAMLEGDTLERARAEARRRREEFANIPFDSMPLAEWTATPPIRTPGWNGSAVEAWRMMSLDLWWRSVTRDPTTNDWIGPFIDTQAIARARASWNRFWLHEVAVEELPREWLRWAVGFLQATRKVTKGTPGDNQISIYCYDADVMVSGDGGFVDIINRARLDAPAPVAAGIHLERENNPLDVLTALWD